MRIEVTLDQFSMLHVAGLTLDSLYILQCVREESKLLPIMEGVVNLLIMRGYLDDNKKVTEKGMVMLGALDSALDAPGSPPVPDTMQLLATNLHAILQLELIRITGHKQKRLQDKYSFLCNRIDLETKLKELWKKYGPLDYELLKKTLVNYVSRCNRAGWEKVMLIEYYIMKNGTSKLMTDMESAGVEEETAEIRPLVNPKDLF